MLFLVWRIAERDPVELSIWRFNLHTVGKAKNCVWFTEQKQRQPHLAKQFKRKISINVFVLISRLLFLVFWKQQDMGNNLIKVAWHYLFTQTASCPNERKWNHLAPLRKTGNLPFDNVTSEVSCTNASQSQSHDETS